MFKVHIDMSFTCVNQVKLEIRVEVIVHMIVIDAPSSTYTTLSAISSYTDCDFTRSIETLGLAG